MQRIPSPSLEPLIDSNQNTTAAQSWDQLRKEARTLEGEIENKLAVLTKIGQSTGLDNTGQEAETDDLLKKVVAHTEPAAAHACQSDTHTLSLSL
jgi:Golgi SNAP receptor complex protein 1